MARLPTTQGYGDFIVLAGQTSPGLCDVSGANSPRKWEKITGYGMGGASLRYLGTDLPEFSIKFRLYGDPQTPDPDWIAWNVFEASVLMKAPAGKRPSALDIWHPVLERLKIKSVVVKDVLQPVQSDTGEWTIEVQFIEFRLAKIALAKPEAAKATPTDPADQVIDALNKQIEAASK